MSQSLSELNYAKPAANGRWARVSLMHAGLGAANVMVDVVLGGHWPMDLALFARFLISGSIMVVIAGFGIWYGVKGFRRGYQGLSLLGIVANIPFLALGVWILYLRLPQLYEAYMHSGGVMKFSPR